MKRCDTPLETQKRISHNNISLRNRFIISNEPVLRISNTRHIWTLLFILPLFSCKTAKLGDARGQYLRGEYYAASETYRNVYRNIKPDRRALRGVVAFEMAEAYRKLNMPARASNAYANAIRYNYPDTTMYLHHAQMLHREGKYAQAKDAYADFLKLDSVNHLAETGLKGIELTEIMKENPTRHSVRKMDLFNSNRSEFSPMLAKEDTELYITSSRNDARGDSVSNITGMKNNDLFLSVKNDKGEWERPKMIESEINTKFDEGTASISSDGRWLYYTFSPVYHNRPSQPKIHVSQRGAESWNAGSELIIVENDTVSMFAHPSISPSGNWLYFVSDMPGGYGGTDIWRAGMNGNTVSYIENMGPEINTPGNEMFPYAKNDSTLLFSSDGHPGMGGLDLFEAHLQPSGLRWRVKNMGFPINSPMDDFGMTVEKNGKNGFFSSNREDARGRDHIYRFEYPELSIQVEGFVVDKEEDFIVGAKIHLIGNDGSQQELVTKKDGTYRFSPRQGVQYILMASADGFLNQRKTLSITTEEKDSTYFADFMLIPYDKPIVLENIFYDFDKAALRPESKSELEELVAMLNEHTEIEMELSAHTDRKGNKIYNQNLSMRRAKSVVDYLIENGIDSKRLSAVGYGKEQPKVVSRGLSEKYDFLKEGDVLNEEFINQLSDDEQEIADQINRRTEFRIIDPSYGLR